MKDFLWWLLKDNTIVNLFYRELMHLLFPIINKEVNNTAPLMNKDKVIEGRGEYHKRPFFGIKGYTSGTTNKPLTVYRSVKSILLEEYIIKSYLKKQGAPLKPRIAILRGDFICPADADSPPFWKKQPFTKRLILSSYHISASTVDLYLKILEEYKPDIIMAYPSSISLLAKYARNKAWKPNWKLVGVFTSSETFKPENQQLVRDVFGNVFDRYGQAERVATLQQCQYRHYHVREDYSCVEFLQDTHGTKIVGSNSHNNAMPLTRYDTGDYVEGLNKSGNCSCGNASPYVTKILGRDDDYIILPDGRQIGRLDVVFKGVNNLVECQLEQGALNVLTVRYVSEDSLFNVRLEKTLRIKLQERLGLEMNFIFENVITVPRTNAGKFRSVIRNKGLVIV